MKEGDIIKCIKPICGASFNEEFNVGDRAIIIRNSFVFKIRKLGSNSFSLMWPGEIHNYFSLHNYDDRKSRIEKLEL